MRRFWPNLNGSEHVGAKSEWDRRWRLVSDSASVNHVAKRLTKELGRRHAAGI